MKTWKLLAFVALILVALAGVSLAATPEEDWQRRTKEGWAALEAGRPADAERRMKEALALAERHWTDQPRVAGSLSTLAQVYVFQKKFKDAEPLYRRADEIRLKSVGKELPR